MHFGADKLAAREGALPEGGPQGLEPGVGGAKCVSLWWRVRVEQLVAVVESREGEDMRCSCMTNAI